VKHIFLLGCYRCIFHGTGNAAQLCQNFGIWGGNPPNPALGTPLSTSITRYTRTAVTSFVAVLKVRNACHCTYSLVQANGNSRTCQNLRFLIGSSLYGLTNQYRVLCPRANKEPGFLHRRSQYGLCRSWWLVFITFLSHFRKLLDHYLKKGTLLCPPQVSCHRTLYSVDRLKKIIEIK
jgi:hypothetical protein